MRLGFLTFAFSLIFGTVVSLAAHAAPPPLQLALNWKAEPQFGGFYAASHGGLFKKAGLDVQLQQGGSGTPTLQMLEAGQVDYAIASADEVILAHDRGAKDLIALFATFQTNPQAIMAHKGKYHRLQDLLADPQITLMWQAGLPYALYLKKKIPVFKAKTAPDPGGLGNFQHDPQIAQQCFLTSEPLLAKHNGIDTDVFLIADTGYNPYATVLVTKASRLKASPDEVKKVVEAVRQGWTNYLQDPSAANTYMMDLNKAMDAATFMGSAQEQAQLIQNSGKPLGQMTEERWKSLVDQLSDLKLIKTKPAVADLFRNL